MVAIIDYDAGNVKSVEKALQFLGQETVLTRDPGKILGADRVILPGVGAFGDAMKRLEDYGLVDVIRKVVQNGTPFLGICLGLQLLFESSEESPGVQGLGILKGRILRIPEANMENIKLPVKKCCQRSWVKTLQFYVFPLCGGKILQESFRYGKDVRKAVWKYMKD